MSKAQNLVAGIPTPYLYRGTVKPEWLDDNGHMNVAYYMSAFDDGGEVLFADPGIGWDYTRQKIGTVFVVSSKVDYLGELLTGDQFSVASRLINFNPKMLHVYYEISKQLNSNADTQNEYQLSATAEILYMHISFKTRRSEPMPDNALARLAQIHEAHKTLPQPETLGAGLGLRS